MESGGDWNYENEDGGIRVNEPEIKVHPMLGLSTVPQMGQYADPYEWFIPVMAVKSSKMQTQEVEKLFPASFLVKNSQIYDADFYILSYDARHVVSQRLIEYG